MAESRPKKTESTPASKPVKAATESQPVIARSARVRELPAPPKIVPAKPAIEPTATESAATGALPRFGTTVELESLDIRAPQRLAPRRRYRLPGPVERWLADPDRRSAVGYMAAGLCHVIVFIVLAITLRGDSATRDFKPIHAREIVERSVYLASVEGGSKPVLAMNAVPAPREIIGPIKPIGPVRPIRPVEPKPATRPLEDSVAGPLPAKAPVLSPPTPAEARALNEAIRAQGDWLHGDFRRRTPGGRAEGTHYGGGTTKSEEAVDRGIAWLLAHQRADGSWSFDHTCDLCMHYCTNPGSETSSTAATGLALLPFLGAGYTHQIGPYQDAVARALKHIRERGYKISYGTDFRDGSMYGHALATIALCEAYGMTHDEELRDAAQGALDFVGYCQDTHSGGWRYNPSESGDTTVTAWMLMALTSGQIAHLNIQSPCLQLAEKFLDSVQSTDGSQYGYIDRRPKPATTAAALLCRMYLGWPRERPALVLGVDHLKTTGPLKESLYFDYYASQVLFHYGGPEWVRWNGVLRDHLIKTQDHDGHASGSWYFKSEQSAAGGRLYNTAMATMILEIYYRHMPLYSEDAVKAK